MIWKSLILILLLSPVLLKAQDLLNVKIELHVKDLPLNDVLNQITENNGVYFTYAGILNALDKKVSLNIENVPLNKLLNDLFYNENIVYTCYSNQIILKKKPEIIKIFKIKGEVLSSESGESVEYASIQFRNLKQGIVADANGKFEFTVSEKDITDSVSFYCIGFETRTISLKALSSLDFHKIFLKPKLVELNPVVLSANKPEIFHEGNRGISMGSLYLDTHGQQVALFIENRRKHAGRIKTLSFYLSGKGNTEAPFRIRIYALNDSLNCPGMELLPDILVVNPENGRGWFDIDILKYNIRFPENGIFIGMEGIYPGDYLQNTQLSKTADNSSTGIHDDFIESSLEYGQRLGYNRFSRNQTWHYSLSHTWFQLDKKLFNVMISAEILVYDPKKNKKPKS